MSIRDRLCAAILAAIASMASGMALAELPRRERRIRYFKKAAPPANESVRTRPHILSRRRKSAHNR